ncbi:MmcQ/YjbR family DNA-binding protein [Lactobacillus delbrueckii subsp. lactis]|nr:MmcQ/YjbR family DNA-binding protein [Lactobacillus delbrueckii]MCD5539876.1 MmcQ/YjbR family DNA-binding protein [Lactobacillus delbrueckii subsp. lactis]MCD5544402.1 MmcQ/YjbR family DNA-binding protein [Lactobacillus delbrueckii subsp. lactis]MCD5547364.1 MmcQ/YjbR family DNA-binding protein [Lactobacillus delbrueckii subsp. lactis]MCD5549163.1 MmcQ/YjbR family DNA-binding protein [Lactobacillus delbrueckii subsp. lactis]MCD5549935.1 MmcQ/YjbR family DNA-binding protein [Lactobacillus de
MMNVEEEIFAKRQCRFNKLAAYGFKKNGDDYYLEVPLKSANFLAKIIVSSVGKVSGNVYDLDTGYEYLLLRVESDTGSFSAVVKAEYRALLQDVADKCFVKAQADRIKDEIKASYGDEPDFPFKKFPNYAVFRNPQNRKWYGLLMTVPLCKLTGDEKDQQEVTVLNLKLAEEKLPALLKQEDFFPAYHMNKQNWLSVLLNNDLPDEEVLAMLDESRAFTERKK